MKHELKTLPVYFEAVLNGDKTFEIRDNSDRGFQKGDTVPLPRVQRGRTGNGCGLRHRLESRQAAQDGAWLSLVL